MTRSPLALTPAALILASALAVSGQSVYPTGTTIYEPARAWSGFTVLSPLNTPSAIVIDMNGTVVKRWEGYNNSAGGPARVLPGGDVIAAAGARPGRQESVELVQRDFEGNIIWRFDRNEQIQSNDGQMIWSARQHHDWQREDFPAGYYSPDARPARSGSNTLLLTHTDHRQPDVADVLLQDDRLIEVSPKGEIVWQWIAGEHLGELGFSESARAAIRGAGRGGARGDGPRGAGPRGDGPRGDGPRGAGARGDGARGDGAGRGAGPGRGGAGFDWLHVNSATYVGPNRWFDAGDRRFAPNNVIISSRQANVLAIVARDGKVVWRLGPDFLESEATRAIGQIIGQHHAHFIPKGLPGAGNLLVFDNGGASGYGPPSGIAPNGTGVYARSNSRVLEIDPVALKLVWSYTAPGRFFSTNISGAQRLPNGNTLVTAGAGGRLFEVTTDGRIVWEYLNPLFAGAQGSNAVYRSYRVPYEWIPQLPRPAEKAVTPPALSDFRVP